MKTHLFIEKIKQILQNTKVQRLLYFLALLVITALFWPKLKYDWGGASTYGISFIGLYAILLVLLGTQIIVNNRIIWAVNLILFTLHWIVAFVRGIADAINDGSRFDLANILGPILLLLFFLGCSWVVCKMKPSKRV